MQTSSKNVFNPENIQVGDTVILKSENSKRYMVDNVSGKNNNKVFCKEIGYELYAQCFEKVENKI